MRTIDLDHGDERRTRRIQLASAACGLSSAEFIRASVDAAIATLADRDKYLRMMLHYTDEQAARPKHEPRAEAMSHL